MRRRTTWFVATVVVLGPTVILAWVLARPVAPVHHFWVRLDDPEANLYDGVDGRVIPGWEVAGGVRRGQRGRGMDAGDVAFSIAPRRSAVARWLDDAGLGTRLRSGYLARLYLRSSVPDLWREGFAVHAALPEGARVDPALVGEWTEKVNGVPRRRELRADGRLVREGDADLEWARDGDVLFLADPRQAGACETAVLSPDGREYRTAVGIVVRKVGP